MLWPSSDTDDAERHVTRRKYVHPRGTEHLLPRTGPQSAFTHCFLHHMGPITCSTCAHSPRLLNSCEAAFPELLHGL